MKQINRQAKLGKIGKDAQRTTVEFRTEYKGSSGQIDCLKDTLSEHTTDLNVLCKVERRDGENSKLAFTASES